MATIQFTEIEIHLLKSGLRARLKKRNKKNNRIEVKRDIHSINQLNSLYSKLEKCII